MSLLQWIDQTLAAYSINDTWSIFTKQSLPYYREITAIPAHSTALWYIKNTDKAHEVISGFPTNPLSRQIIP